MLLIFVIVGTLTLSASVFGLLNVPARSTSGVVLHVGSLALMAAAWWMTHESATGRYCLLAAAGIEGVAFLVRRRAPRNGAPSAADEQRTGWRTISTGREAAARVGESSLAHTDSAAPVGVGSAPPAEIVATKLSQPDEDACLAANWTPEQGEIAAAKARAGIIGTGHAGRKEGKSTSAQASSPHEPIDHRRDPHVGEVFALPKEPAASGNDASPDHGVGAGGTAESSEQARPLSLRSEVFISRECSVPPGVFVASLRRNGRRDASVIQTAEGAPSRIAMGDVLLDFELMAEPRDPLLIEETLTHFDYPPDLGDRVRRHAGRVELHTRYAFGTPRDQVVRLHHQAHAALTEFAPVVAAFWPDARMLSAVEQLTGLLEYARSPSHAMWRTCTHIRGFALSGDNEGTLLFDSVGLTAFGLPDVQVIAPSSAEAAARATIDLITERFFVTGCDLPHGTEYTASGGLVWRVNYTRSAFVPDREVVQLALKTGS